MNLKKKKKKTPAVNDLPRWLPTNTTKKRGGEQKKIK